MDPTGPMSQGPPGGSAGDTAPPGSPAADAVDRALLREAVLLQVAQNRAHATRLELMHTFHARRVAEVAAREAGEPGPWDDQPGFFLLTPLQSTKAELGPVLGLSEMFVQLDLDLLDDLKRWLPGVWERCLAGRLDISRAVALREQLSQLAGEDERGTYGELVEAWLARHDGQDSPLVTVPRARLQRAAARIRRGLPQRSPDTSFAAAFEKRRVSLRSTENGMAALTAMTAVHDAISADHRLTLIAKRRREAPGESRTLAQLRADTLVDLVLGRLGVAASDGELDDGCVEGSGCAEHEGGPDDASCVDPAASFDWATVGAFARPVVNVTVSLTTLIGLDEADAAIGGIPVPADLARRIGADPDSVWHRMLTDPSGGHVELSTDAYSPSGQIWRWVVSRDVTCVFPGCDRPAALVELDHRVPWPLGRTWTWNLQPLCPRHHKVKHSHGFTVVREGDGAYTWTSRFGSVLRTPPPEYPRGAWDDLVRQLLGEPDPSTAGPWTPEELGDPMSDPAMEAAYREWFITEVLPTL